MTESIEECCGNCEHMPDECMAGLGWCEKKEEETTCDDYCGEFVAKVVD